MLMPELNKISFLGFYLLTEALEARGPRAVAAKKRLYNAQAIAIHKQIKHRLPVLARLEVDGGAGWAMSERDFKDTEQFEAFQRELEKRLTVFPC